VASSTAGPASPGAPFAADFTSSLLRLPAALRSYVDDALSGLAVVFGRSPDSIQSATGLSPAVLLGTLAAALLVAVALSRAVFGTRSAPDKKRRKKRKKKMSRYGWSGQDREELSPFNSNLGRGGVPSVTDQDYEYITSEDLQSQGVDSQHAYNYEPRGSSHHLGRHGASSGPALEIPDDDVLLIRHGRTDYREYFPAYSIGDGKLLTGDVRDRIQLILKLSDKRTGRVKMLYKGKQLKDDKEPVCRYGVKNNSEVMVVVPDAPPGDGSDSGEEIVVVENDDIDTGRRPGRNRSVRGKDNGPRGPRSSGLDVPGHDGNRGSRGQSPASGVSVASASSAAAGGPIDKLNGIASHFTTVLLPLCEQFTASPPTDAKKRADEHRKLSETVMQQVILKLDAVETSGDEQARARRKELVRHVQEVLKGLDGLVSP